MSRIYVYGLKNCDTCRKAVASLRASGQDVEMVDVRAAPLSRDQLSAFLAAFGTENLINRRSTTWKSLTDIEKVRDPLDLLLAHPPLMKRPVIERYGALYLGWTPEVQAELGTG